MRTLDRAWVILLAAGCGAVAAQPSVEPPNAQPTQSPTEAPPPADDEPWFIEHDCGLCHQIDTRTIGPGYRDIAGRYPATDETIDRLAAHVVEGSVGQWGDTPMTPHAMLGLDEARAMVKRILALGAAH
jgi:cytochrome c